MPKRISSSDWTGPIDLGPQRGAFTYGAGQHSISSDYQHILEAERAAAVIPPEVRRVMRWAAFAFLSPICLLLAWCLVGAVTSDAMGWNHVHVLILLGLGVMALAAWQVQSRSTALLGLRRLFLIAACVATGAVALAYALVGIAAHARATALAPERTFEFYTVHGRKPFRHVETWHQRRDGSIFEGGKKKRPMDYATACAQVQWLNGPYGFSWVRVLARSRPPARGQLYWPIRREECFSNIPLSSLPR